MLLFPTFKSTNSISILMICKNTRYENLAVPSIPVNSSLNWLLNKTLAQ